MVCEKAALHCSLPTTFKSKRKIANWPVIFSIHRLASMSARELVLERDLVAPLLSPWLVPRDVMSLSETSKACLREVRAGLQELDMVDKYGLTNEHVITIVRCFPSLRSLSLNCDEDITDAAVSAIARLSRGDCVCHSPIGRTIARLGVVRHVQLPGLGKPWLRQTTRISSLAARKSTEPRTKPP